MRPTLLLALTSLWAAAPAAAADLELGLYTGLVVVGPNHELYDPATSTVKPVRPGPALGARVGFRPVRALVGELEAHGALGSVPDAGGATLYAYRAQVLGIAPLDLPADLEPFLALGGGNIGIASDADVLGGDLDWAWHAGAGARLPISGSLSLRADLRLLFADRNVQLGTTGGHTEALVGLMWRPTPEADADADGLADSKDACADEPETVNGWKDDDGCPDTLATVTLVVSDTEGLPAEGIVVFADDREVGRTGADGRLAVEGLMPEEAVTLRAEHFHVERPEQRTFTPTEGESEGAVTVEWMPGRVRVVTMAEGTPMAGATAAFSGPKDVPTAPVEGGDQLFFLAPGDWKVLVTADTYGTELVDLSIGPDERSLIVIEMELEPAQVEVTREEVRILQKVLFESGSAAIVGESLGLLNEVAGTLLANPQLRKIEIQGHTDSQGPRDFNRRLSQSRVDSVRTWLVERGIDEDRLTARGFGEDGPIADNATEEGRAKNRRVVFVILEQDGVTEEPAE